jgi:sugar phosphate isomerase/epimerase
MADWLVPAVLTSSSAREFVPLVCELAVVSGVDVVDVYLLRDVDLEDIERTRRGQIRSGIGASSIDVMCEEQNVVVIADWLHTQMKECENYIGRNDRPIRISALATYFPDISSLTNRRQVGSRQRAINALAHSVCIALELHERGVMEQPIVEAVCGNVVDLCTCSRCNQDRAAGDTTGTVAVMTARSDKWRILSESLLGVIELVEKIRGRAKWAIGLELEPGETYVVNDGESIRELFDKYIDRDERLGSHVGLNMDVAHMKIANVETSILRQYRERIVHSHICDHPGMHTRDQQVGEWSHIDRYNSPDYQYLKILAERADGADESSGLPFSKAVAIELEGCNRIRWIHNSVIAVRHMLEVVKHHRSAIK